MSAPHSPGAPSAQAGLTFALGSLGLFQLGSPDLLLWLPKEAVARCLCGSVVCGDGCLLTPSPRQC